MEGKLFAFIAVGVLVGAAIGGGIGFAAFGNKTTDDETYYFYIDFGDSDQKSGWYSAKAANADDALIKAVDGKDITLTWSGGYPAFGEGFWAVYNYTWDTFTKKAADNSEIETIQILRQPVKRLDRLNVHLHRGVFSYIGEQRTVIVARLERSVCAVARVEGIERRDRLVGLELRPVRIDGGDGLRRRGRRRLGSRLRKGSDRAAGEQNERQQRQQRYQLLHCPSPTSLMLT